MDQLHYSGWNDQQQQSSGDKYESRVVHHREYDCATLINHSIQSAFIESPCEPYNLPICHHNSNLLASCSATTLLPCQVGLPMEMPFRSYVMGSSEPSGETQQSSALLNHQTEFQIQWPLGSNNINHQQATQINQYEVSNKGQSQLMQSMTTFPPQPHQYQPLSQQLLSNSTDNYNQGHQLNGSYQEQQQLNTALANNNMQPHPQFVPHKKKTTIPRPMFDIINCLCCGIEYDSSSELSTHMHRQHPQLFGKCGQFGCGRSFPDFSYLMEHFNNHHPQAMMKFMCHLCGSIFTTTNALNTHFLYYHHSGRFMCTQVGCRYVDEYQYKVQQHYYIEHVGAGDGESRLPEPLRIV